MKRETKELETEIHPGKGVLKGEKFLFTRKPSHWQVCGEFWNLRRQHNWKKKTKNQHNTQLTTTEEKRNFP